MSITIIRFKKCVCDECGKEGRGVEFQLLDDPQNVSFLCWFHWRANTEILLEAGIVIRYPRQSARGRTQIAGISEGWSEGETESWGGGTSESIGISDVGNIARTRSRSVSRSRSIVRSFDEQLAELAEEIRNLRLGEAIITLPDQPTGDGADGASRLENEHDGNGC
jgi:hypothetical protein